MYIVISSQVLSANANRNIFKFYRQTKLELLKKFKQSRRRKENGKQKNVKPMEKANKKQTIKTVDLNLSISIIASNVNSPHSN